MAFVGHHHRSFPVPPRHFVPHGGHGCHEGIPPPCPQAIHEVPIIPADCPRFEPPMDPVHAQNLSIIRDALAAAHEANLREYERAHEMRPISHGSRDESHVAIAHVRMPAIDLAPRRHRPVGDRFDDMVCEPLGPPQIHQTQPSYAQCRPHSICDAPPGAHAAPCATEAQFAGPHSHVASHVVHAPEEHFGGHGHAYSHEYYPNSFEAHVVEGAH